MPPRAASLRTGERAALLAAEDGRALAAALVMAPADPSGVHEARKCIRRLRSLLALGRRALDKEAVDAIDDELRALAKGLSALRDAQVVQDTAQTFVRDARRNGESASWKALLPLLAQRQQQVLAAALHEDPGFMQRQAQAHRQVDRMRQLPWQRLRATDLRQAVARTMQRQTRAQAIALASGSLEDLHAWRRRSRRLRMQLSALRKLRVHAQRGHDDAATLRHIAELVDHLGVLQDLALLKQALDAMDRTQARAAPMAARRPMPSPIQPLG